MVPALSSPPPSLHVETCSHKSDKIPIFLEVRKNQGLLFDDTSYSVYWNGDLHVLHVLQFIPFKTLIGRQLLLSSKINAHIYNFPQ